MVKTQGRTGTPGGAKSYQQIGELASIGDVKRYLVSLIQRVERGRITVKKANCLNQIANTLINAIVDHELETRIAQLEGKRAGSHSQIGQSTTITVQAGGSA